MALDIIRIKSYTLRMKILAALWRYWKWLCVAIFTTFVVLYLLAALLGSFKSITINDDRPQKCLDTGGAWNADDQRCHIAS